MKSANASIVTAVMVLASAMVAAVAPTKASSAHNHPRYRLFDLGPGTGVGAGVILANHQGDVVGGVLTSIPNPDLHNPNPLWGPTEFTTHTFRWRNGRLSDLGTLPGGHNSGAVAVNESGTIVGLADNGVIDPLTGYRSACLLMATRRHARFRHFRWTGQLGLLCE